MLASVQSTRSDVTTTASAFITRLELQDTLKIVNTVLGVDQTTSDPEIEVELLAQGGYNSIWLVSFIKTTGDRKTTDLPAQFILREPTEDALLPHQIENEIAFLTHMTEGPYSRIPVPKVYAYNIGINGQPPFIAMEYIRGEPLSTVWKSYSEPEKSAIANEVAEMIVDMAEITFDRIGGLTLAQTIGPTIEGHKLFKGRDKFHSSSYYDIGPYASTHAYVLACYAKEIYYYTHALDSDIDMDLFETIPKAKFVKSLQATHDELASRPDMFLPEEPFVINHGDFNGRNILMANGRIRAVIDWEFAGSYPLSEVLDGTVFDVVEMDSEEDADENFKWDDRITALVGDAARARGWEDSKVDLLVNHHNRVLQGARMEMIPDDFTDEEEHEPEEVIESREGEEDMSGH